MTSRVLQRASVRCPCADQRCPVLFAAVHLLPSFMQDVNKDPGAEDTFKQIGEAYEVGGAGLAGLCMVQQWKLQQTCRSHAQHVRHKHGGGSSGTAAAGQRCA
jgi:hypothetical protein